VTGLTLSGAGNGKLLVTQPTGLTAAVTKKALTVTGVSASDKVYDATLTAPLGGTAALLATEAAGAGTTGDGQPYAVDSVALGGTAAGAFADRHVATNKAITVTGLTLGGAGNGNYSSRRRQPDRRHHEESADGLRSDGGQQSLRHHHDGDLAGTAAPSPPKRPATARLPTASLHRRTPSA